MVMMSRIIVIILNLRRSLGSLSDGRLYFVCLAVIGIPLTLAVVLFLGVIPGPNFEMIHPRLFLFLSRLDSILVLFIAPITWADIILTQNIHIERGLSFFISCLIVWPAETWIVYRVMRWLSIQNE